MKQKLYNVSDLYVVLSLQSPTRKHTKVFDECEWGGRGYSAVVSGKMLRGCKRRNTRVAFADLIALVQPWKEMKERKKIKDIIFYLSAETPQHVSMRTMPDCI